mmetsp:Transcript_10889/g.26108  ORF Transcript_10889/g.26108 Transcript_10889/m.26108 type:complete len:204 (-) Transcript_10889:152-763(-)
MHRISRRGTQLAMLFPTSSSDGTKQQQWIALMGHLQNRVEAAHHGIIAGNMQQIVLYIVGLIVHVRDRASIWPQGPASRRPGEQTLVLPRARCYGRPPGEESLHGGNRRKTQCLELLGQMHSGQAACGEKFVVLIARSQQRKPDENFLAVMDGRLYSLHKRRAIPQSSDFACKYLWAVIACEVSCFVQAPVPLGNSQFLPELL